MNLTPPELTSVQIAALQLQPISIQAVAISDLLERWLQLYGLLKTSGLYQGNHFAVQAEAIRKQAEKEGISDGILSECAAFASALGQATRKKK